VTPQHRNGVEEDLIPELQHDRTARALLTQVGLIALAWA
jgi:hypothetical protein